MFEYCEMVFELSSILSLIVIFQLLFISGFLLSSKRGKRLSNVLLGVFFILIAINLLDLFLSIHGLYTYYARVALVDDGFFLAFGPLIFLYTKSVIYRNFVFRKRALLHFIPFFIFTFLLVLLQNLSPPEPRVQILTDIQSGNMPVGIQFVSLAMHFHILVYSYFAYREVIKFRNVIRQRFSTIDKINLDWLNFMIKMLTIIILVALVNNFIPFTFLKDYVGFSLIILILFILYFISRVIFTALKQPALFSGIELEQEIKYAGSSLTDSERLDYEKVLSRFMEKEKLYQQSDLTIDQLATTVEINPKILSQVINQSFNKSYFDFINGYRIQEAQRIMANSDDDRLTIQEVLYQSGFNSKSSFNTFFKKETGLTPSEFKRSIQKEKLV